MRFSNGLRVTDYYDRAEVKQLLELLFRDKATMSALNTLARMQALKTTDGYHAYRDLIAEAVSRVLALTRRWRRGEPTRAFLEGVIRSIAWEWRLKRDPDSESAVVPLSSDSERDMITKQRANQLLGLFEDDHIARQIFIGMVNGLEGEELKENNKLTQVEYETKRRLVRRRIQKFMFAEHQDD